MTNRFQLSHSPSPAEFFGWRHHPFTDTFTLSKPYFSRREKKILHIAHQLVKQGKSISLCGPSGSGKSTLIQHLLSQMDRNHFKTALIPYGGHNRGGILRTLADSLDVDVSGRSVPVLLKIQKHLLQLTQKQNPLFPVIVVDDAQLMESESYQDLCSLLYHPGRETVSASLILTGDQSLKKKLLLDVMAPVRTRLACSFSMDLLSEDESMEFIAARLDAAHAPKDLFDDDAITMLAAESRGNKRQIMNTASLLVLEAMFQKEKTIGAQLLLSGELW